MKSSIRSFLLINLLFAITITTTLSAIGNYYLDQKEIQEHLDGLMAISALSYQALLGHNIHKRPLVEIQKSLETIPMEFQRYNTLYKTNNNKNLFDKFNFQVWTDGGKLLLHSPNTPRIPLIADGEGFNDKVINQQRWRVFTAYNAKAGVRIVLAERYNSRNELGRSIAKDDLYIMLLTFPLSGLLIWIIIGRGLDSLDRVAKEVADREATHLEPVNLEEVPQEIKPVIDELNQLFYRLQESFEREKRFSADAAHELKTPLAALKAQVQVALKVDDLSEKNKILHKIISSVNRSTHTIQQLLIMNRLVPEAAVDKSCDAFDLIKVAREVLTLQAPYAVEKNIDLSFETTGKGSKIYGNPTTMSLLIRNIVDNAIRYSRKNGTIVVRVYEKLNRIILEVQDTGPGIADELKQRVFERFFRVLGNTSPGSGLGLAIVKQITQMHHGTIELITPSDALGLIVQISFPIAKTGS